MPQTFQMLLGKFARQTFRFEANHFLKELEKAYEVENQVLSPGV